MTETEFIALAQKTLDELQSALDVFDEEIDIDRHGNVFTLTFEDDFQIVVNLQTPMKQIWLASLKGGYRFDFVEGYWQDARNQETLMGVLSSLISKKLNRAVELS